MKTSDSSYLRKRFELLDCKGLDKVCHNNGYGTNKQIEIETLGILKENKKRFIKS